jgi:hypothetical protein
MANKRTELHKHPVQLPEGWKFLLAHRRTIGFIVLGAAIAFIADAMRFPWQASRFPWQAAPSPLLHTRQQPKDLSAPVLDPSAKAIVIDPATQSITLEAIDSAQQSD